MNKFKLGIQILAGAVLLVLAGLGVMLLLKEKMAESVAGEAPVVKREGQAPVKPAAPAPEPAGDAPGAGFAFSKRLAEAGVKSCVARIDDLGKGVMGGVANFFPASNWNIDAPDSHLASVIIGQKYDNAKLPFGFAGLFAAPNGHGGCDGVSVQVLPSPNDCALLRQDLLKRGKLIGDLAGVPFIQDIGSQIALVTTGANTCVMISIHTAFGAKP